MSKDLFKIDKGLNLPARTLPVTPDEGDRVRDIADGKFKFYENGAWHLYDSDIVSLDSSTTGSAATITPSTVAQVIRLSNSSLVSLSMIASPTSGRTYTIINQTGNAVTINNDSGGTAANRIKTGTKGNLTLLDESSIIVKYDDTEARWMVIGGSGSGSGSGGINYNLNPAADLGTTGYARYANSVAGASPDAGGTGGSPNAAFTFTTTSTSPLRGLNHFVITKDANNRQGHGVSYAFTIDAADKSSRLPITFDYNTSVNYMDTVSGNLVDSDVRMYVYDVTNSSLIEVDQQNVAANEQGHYTGTFQSNANSTSYRLIWHVASTNANSWTMAVDNISIGSAKALIKGTVITDWRPATVTGSWTTNTTYSAKKRQVGDSYEYEVFLTLSGANTQGELTVNLEAGDVIDVAKIHSSPSLQQLGKAWVYDDTGAGTGRLEGYTVYNNTTSVRVDTMDDSAATDHYNRIVNSNTNVPITFASSDRVHLSFRVPIVGKSSNLTLSEDGGTRLIATKAGLTSNQTVSSTAETKVTLNTVTATAMYDTAGSFDITNNRFIANETGKYTGSVFLNISNLTAAETIQCSVKKNGTTYICLIDNDTNNTGRYITFPFECELIKGDYLEITVDSAADTSYIINSALTYLAVHKVSSPQTLAGSEVVACSYSTNSGQAVVNGNTIVYEDKLDDTHSAYNTSTGVFTAPMSGRYLVCASIGTVSVIPGAANQQVGIRVTTSSGLDKTGEFDVAETTASRSFSSIFSNVFTLNKGETMTVIFEENLPAVNLSTSPRYNTLSIIKIG